MLYDRPLWELMADAAAAMPDRFAPADVVAWFGENYPGFKENALRAHVVGLTANDPSRRHHWLAPKTPLFFNLDRGVLTAFDPDRHAGDVIVPEPQPHGDDATSDAADEDRMELYELVEGRVYSWDDLAQLFGFEPGWLNRMGGMGSLPRHDAVLIISHPGGGKSFDYDDYWDGADLIYTGHGQRGDQQRTGTNRYVGDVDEWPETALDRDGNDRRVIRFRLRFETDAPPGGGPAGNGTRAPSADPERRPRPFDRSRPPRPRSSNGRGRRRDPAETAALQEKAVQAHYELVSTVNDALLAAGWTDVGEIPAAIDLWGRSPDGARTIFEMKTLRPASELGRVRDAIAQLLEHRYFFGAPEDDLCVVTDHPLSDKRVRLMRTLGIGVLIIDGDRLIPGSPDARERLHRLLDDATPPST